MEGYNQAMKYNKLSIVAVALLLIPIVLLILASLNMLVGTQYGGMLYTLILGVPVLCFLLGAIALHQIYYNPAPGKLFAYAAMLPGILGMLFIAASVFLGGECGPSAACKGTNAMVKGNLNMMRTYAEEYKKTHADFGVAYNSCNVPNTVFTDSEIAKDIKQIKAKKLAVSCYADTTTWAASSTLVGGEKDWCTDSTGVIKEAQVNLETHLCEQDDTSQPGNDLSQAKGSISEAQAIAIAFKTAEEQYPGIYGKNNIHGVLVNNVWEMKNYTGSSPKYLSVKIDNKTGTVLEVKTLYLKNWDE